MKPTTKKQTAKDTSLTASELKPTHTTRQHVLAACGNRCAFHPCDATIFDLTEQVFVGELAHIKGEKPESARYDPKQDPEERRSFSNLMAMCAKHHKIIDRKEEKYTTASCLKMKNDHEQKVAKEQDRNWLRPPNIGYLSIDGENLKVHFWLNKKAEPRIYSDEQLAITNVLERVRISINALSDLHRVAVENPTVSAQEVVSHVFPKGLEIAALVSLAKLMARAPDVTFGEFLQYLIQGANIDPLVVEGQARVLQMAAQNPAVSPWK